MVFPLLFPLQPARRWWVIFMQWVASWLLVQTGEQWVYVMHGWLFLNWEVFFSQVTLMPALPTLFQLKLLLVTFPQITNPMLFTADKHQGPLWNQFQKRKAEVSAPVRFYAVLKLIGTVPHDCLYLVLAISEFDLVCLLLCLNHHITSLLFWIFC